MVKIIEKTWHRLVFVLLCALALIACDSSNDDVLDVSVRTNVLEFQKGQVYVSVRCSGDWSLSLQADEGETEWAWLDITSGHGNKSGIKLTYDANNSEHSRDLRIVLDNGSKWVSFSLQQKSAFEGSVVSPTYPNGMDLTAYSWLELPALDDPALKYYTHSFTMNGKSYRNYSFGWSQSDRVALWVAYPLSRDYLYGFDGRSEAWALDPLLGNLSSAPFGRYAGSYSKGHQLASEDRQCCYEANAQTFYGTNIVPQTHDKFNNGIWAALEGRVRDFSRSADTLYVVTGVVVSPSSKTEKDSYGQSVTVPDAFFKAVLKYSKSSTLGIWNAAAFYLEHRVYDGGIKQEHSMSIDKLEEKTGIDFFANLPAKVGIPEAARIEAVNPANVSMWWQ